MRLRAFEFNEPLPQLREPHALVILQPWVDVGNVGTMTLAWLETQCKAREVGRLARPGDFFDFTRYRPTISLLEGRRVVNIPNVTVSCGKWPGGRDFLFLHLLEPHNQSEEYIESLLHVLNEFKVRRYCLLGSMYDVVPHTKPLIVTGGSAGQGVANALGQHGIEPSDYEGPTTITLLVSQRAPEMGIETMSMIVHLPQYTQAEEDYTGTLRLMKILSSMYGVPVDQSYAEKSEHQLKQIDQAVSANSQLQSIIEQLENHYEARVSKKKDKEPHLSPEIEKFLLEMDQRFDDN